MGKDAPLALNSPREKQANLQNLVQITVYTCKITGTVKHTSCQHILRFWKPLDSSNPSAMEWEVLDAQSQEGGALGGVPCTVCFLPKRLIGTLYLNSDGKRALSKGSLQFTVASIFTGLEPEL